STALWWSWEPSLMEKMWTGQRRKSGSTVGSSLFLTALAMLFVHVVGHIRGPADPEKKSDAGRYTKSDVLFAVCHIILIYSYMGCGWTDRMVYEFYFLAICEVLWTSCLHAMLKKTGRVGASNVLEAMLPFGERFDLLRDATAVANYVCMATAWSYAGLAVVLSTNILGTMLIFWRRDDLRQLRSAAWPWPPRCRRPQQLRVVRTRRRIATRPRSCSRSSLQRSLGPIAARGWKKSSSTS
ncbi:unnamed protein product, partial [Symbiodinium sp. KB8]